MQVIRFALLIATSAIAAAQTNTPVPAQAPPASLPQTSQVWQMQDSGTTAGLRGIDSVDGNVAWASGTSGTVLKTIDGGAHWQKCAVPDARKDGATLDFRGVEAWDAKTAIVMASGPGDKSRLYKTWNGCHSWKLILKNRNKNGFWDDILLEDGILWLLGDPVDGYFFLLTTRDGYEWIRQKNSGLKADRLKESAFAASNSALLAFGEEYVFVATGGQIGGKVRRKAQPFICFDACSEEDMNLEGKKDRWAIDELPLAGGSESSGAFAISGRMTSLMSLPLPHPQFSLVVVGGDYTKPNDSAGTAAFSTDSGEHWTASTTPPHGYRSAVQWAETLKLWITVGTNGSDLSRDDGKTWQPLDDGNWNALSLPFVVGPNGRIARFNPSALPPAK
jgi:photosystem II stability/assembly factor-like uncharacterized protein